MPCRVDPEPEPRREVKPKHDHENKEWDIAFRRHHDEIETILENLVDLECDLKAARLRMRAAKRRLADRYEELFEDIHSAEDIQKKRTQILGKYA